MNDADVHGDDLLHDALSPVDRPADQQFVLRIQRLAIAEQKLRAARKAAFARFSIELAGTLSVAATFLLMRHIAADHWSGTTIFSGPGGAGLMLLLVWLSISTNAECLNLRDAHFDVLAGRLRTGSD